MNHFNNMKTHADKFRPNIERQSVNWILEHARDLTRKGLIFVLDQLDHNGIWSDEAALSEGYDPLTFNEAVESLRRLVEDMNSLELQAKERGFYVPVGVFSPESLESYARNYYDSSFKDLPESEKWTVILAIS